jgi:hypothetical protein
MTEDSLLGTAPDPKQSSVTVLSMATATTTAVDPTPANDSASNTTVVSAVNSGGGGGGGGALSPEWLLALLALLARQAYRRVASAGIYAQWGDRPKALESLETAMRLRDPGLDELKIDPLMDPLREEPRFQAIMQELRFPD